MSERLFLRLEGDAVHGPEAPAPAGTLRAGAVHPALRRHVSQLLHYREHLAPGEEVVERVLPDGAVRLVFNLGEAPTASGATAYPLQAIGASAEPALVRLRGHVEGLSVALAPGAAAPLLGMPAGELAGQVVPIDAIWRGEGAEAIERISAAADDAARFAVLQELLLRRLRRAASAPSPVVTRAVRRVELANGQQSLRQLAAELGVGERRLQQLFHAQVGLSPRTFSRLARLRACLRMLRDRPAVSWAQLALDGGFYDQSHLTNEFRAICGVTPTEFLRRTISLSSKTPR